jgi:hypothetical protein
MSGNGKKPEPMLTWTVQLGIPVPVRLARRASRTALAKYLAKALGRTFQAVPAEFIAQSAEKVKADIGQSVASLVGADGRPYRM